MKLQYDVIEDVYDDTTHIRTMTEIAPVPTGGWLLRTTLYTPHHLATDVQFLPGKGKKQKKPLFTPIT
ncbi:MAG: hypothetical protein GY703_25160 [Gammaproteobacteria bacterium]|nr:hypothetical protein [Gammaproteobacteria bacterium]